VDVTGACKSKGGLIMGIKKKLSAGLKAIQEETQKQFEKTKEAINNYKPHQLEKKMKIN